MVYIAPHVHKWSRWYPSDDYAVYVSYGPGMQWRACKCGRVEYDISQRDGAVNQ